MPVADIDTDAVMRVLQPIWHTKPETASRLRGRIERVLNAAKTQGLRTGENPARWSGHLAELLPKTSKVKTKRHHAALPFANIPQFMQELRERDGIAARALELLILCGVRTGDIIGQKRDDKPPMRWDHLERDVWTIPETKNGKKLRVPLPDRARAILSSLLREDSSPFVFVGSAAGTSLKEAAMRDLLKTLRSGLTVHGFRSSFASWAAERTNYPKDIYEMALAHKVGSETWEAYQRGDLLDKRRTLMNAWARYCGQKPASESPAVVALRR
jgi:integrase